MPDLQGVLNRVLHPFDRWQQRTRGPRFVFAVIKKFGDDRGSILAALVTFYAFLSIFPLLLVATTILGFALHGDPSLQARVQNSVLNQFPVIGHDLAQKRLSGSGFGLIVGLIGLLWGSLGCAQSLQFAITEAWGVPNVNRPGFFPRTARALSFVGLLGSAVVATTALTSIATALAGSVVAAALGVVGILGLSVALFLAVFKVMGPGDVGWREHLPGAVIAGVAWQVLQIVGQTLVRHDLKHLSDLYGQFAVVLGLISFLSIVTRIVVYAVEVNVVRAKGLWPRSLFPPPFLEADRRSLEMRAEVEARLPGEDVHVEWDPPAVSRDRGV